MLFRLHVSVGKGSRQRQFKGDEAIRCTGLNARVYLITVARVSGVTYRKPLLLRPVPVPRPVLPSSSVRVW